MNKKVSSILWTMILPLLGMTQVESSLYGVNGTSIDWKKQAIKRDSTGTLFYATSDKSKIVFFPSNLRIYKLYDGKKNLLLEGDLGGKMFFTDYVLRHGKWTEYYPNGIMKAVGFYREDKPIGFWRFYHLNGQLKKELSYLVYKDTGFSKDSMYFNCLSDQYVEYYDNSQVKVKGSYRVIIDTVDSYLHYWEGDKKKLKMLCKRCDLKAASTKSGIWTYYKRNEEIEKQERY